MTCIFCLSLKLDDVMFLNANLRINKNKQTTLVSTNFCRKKLGNFDPATLVGQFKELDVVATH